MIVSGFSVDVPLLLAAVPVNGIVELLSLSTWGGALWLEMIHRVPCL